MACLVWELAASLLVLCPRALDLLTCSFSGGSDNEESACNAINYAVFSVKREFPQRSVSNSRNSNNDKAQWLFQ